MAVARIQTMSSPATPERDLAMLACRASIELQSISVGRRKSKSSIERLANYLSRATTSAEGPASHHSVYQFGATNLVLIADSMSTPPESGEEILQEASSIAVRLKSVADDAEKPDPHEVENLAHFCLELSRRASALESPAFQTRGRR